MSNQLTLIENEIFSIEPVFQEVLVTPSIQFRREAEFAMQIMAANDYTARVALQKPQSLRDAVTNVAALGVSLNPAKKQAYLVPRKTGITLVVSWMGLIDLAVDCGSISFAKAELVYEADELIIDGYDKPPRHQRNPFSKNRGELVGAYCVAKLTTGDWLTEVMSVEELHSIRDRSESWKKDQSGPWKTDYLEMCKKSVVRRASKSWPRKTSSDDRLSRAIDAADRDPEERVDYGSAPAAANEVIHDVQSMITQAQSCATEEALLEVYSKSMQLLNEARDADGMRRFKAAALARREQLRANNAGDDNTVEA